MDPIPAKGFADISSQSPYPPETFRRPYASARHRARIVTILLAAGGVLSFAVVLLSLLQLVFPKLALTEAEINEPELLVFGLLMLGVGLMQVAVYVATIVAFLMWLYRSYENLPSFGVRTSDIQYASGWAVGSFFVPFVNLVVPYRAVKELWTRSVPKALEMFSDPAAPAFFPLWWAAWLISNFADNMYTRMSWRGRLSPETDASLAMLTGMLEILAAILAIMVVKEIDRQQEASAALIPTQFGSPGLPPPPNFDAA